MRRWLLVLLLVPLLAGCTEDPSADLDGAGGDGATHGTPTETTCDGTEDCSIIADGETYTCDDEEIRCTVTYEEGPLQTPVEYDGHTKEGFFVCTAPDGTGTCPAGQQIQPDGDHVTTVQYYGNLTRVDLHLEWSPEDATQTGLVLAVYGSAGSLLAIEEGTSSFHMELDVTNPDEDGDPDVEDTLTLIVWPSAKVQQSPSVFADATQQPFTITGELGSVQPAIQSVLVEWVGPA